jgi:TRAP-type C4-dicarboxylate transport system substrate-binding protein
MKKITFVSLIMVLVLVLGIAFSACNAKPASETPSEGSETPASETTAKSEVIKMKLAYCAPAAKAGRYSYVQEIDNWAAQIVEKSNGRVQIDVYPGESLLEYENLFQGVVNGQAEIGYWSPHYDMSAFSFTSVYEVPGVPWTTSEATYNIMHDIYDEFPELQDEFEGTKLLFLTSQPAPLVCISKDKVIKVPADMKGLKLACADSSADLMEAVGATPVSMPAADRYLAIERSMVDGTEIIWGGVLAFQLMEVCKTFTENIGFGQSSNAMIMNQKTWDSLPSDIQELFNSMNEPGAVAILDGYISEGDAARETVRNAGRTIYAPTMEEAMLWSEAYGPLREAWIQEREAEGLPGREAVDELLRLAQEYSK